MYFVLSLAWTRGFDPWHVQYCLFNSVYFLKLSSTSLTPTNSAKRRSQLKIGLSYTSKYLARYLFHCHWSVLLSLSSLICLKFFLSNCNTFRIYTGTTVEGLFGVFLYGRCSYAWHILALLINAPCLGATWSHGCHSKFDFQYYTLHECILWTWS